MLGLLQFLRGVYRVELRAAVPENCLNAFAAHDLHFWEPERIDALTYRVSIQKQDYSRAAQLATRAMAELHVLRELSVHRVFYGLKRRPILLASLLLSVLAALLLPRFVWTVTVRGNVRLHEAEILRELDALGVHFGAWGGGIDSQDIKNRILRRIPELEWCAVNRTGGCVTVLVHERPETEEIEDRSTVTNVVAARDGIITEMLVLGGFPLCTIGQSVSEGELLLSGYQEWPTHVQATHAYGEIYALTQRKVASVLPLDAQKKVYTGRSWTLRTLIVGRKRIKLSGNSRISTMDCDKIIQEQPLTLPEGHRFPVTLVTETYREYRLVPTQRTEAAAQSALSLASARYVRGQMIGGSVLQTQERMEADGTRYILHAQYDCREMIARCVPAPICKGETYAADGEND